MWRIKSVPEPTGENTEGCTGVCRTQNDQYLGEFTVRLSSPDLSQVTKLDPLGLWLSLANFGHSFTQAIGSQWMFSSDHYKGFWGVEQQFPISVLQEFLKHAIPNYLVRGTDLFSLRLSN